MKDLSTLGRELAEAQDAALDSDESDLVDARARLLGPPPRRRLSAPGAIAGGLALVAAAGLVVWSQLEAPSSAGPVPAPSPLVYEVDGHPADPGEWLSALPDDSLELTFSDGSRVHLDGDGDARITRIDHRGAVLDLSRGRAHVAVVHRADTSWGVHAGPFTVEIIGTEFEVDWDPETARFEIAMERGQVEVVGPVVERRSVRDNERLRVWLREGRLEQASTDVPTTPSPAPVELAVAPSASPPTPAGDPPSPDTAERTGPASRARVPAMAEPARPGPAELSPADRGPETTAEAAQPGPAELSRAGRYAEAMEAAEARGWQQTLSDLDGPSLLHLGNAARFVGQLDKAEDAYRTVRSRFTGVHRARAAFALGRLAMDQQNAPARAATNFEAFLAEAPTDALAREAAGRLIEARQRAGDATGARRAAVAYLSRYPDGPHAPLARSLAPR